MVRGIHYKGKQTCEKHQNSLERERMISREHLTIHSSEKPRNTNKSTTNVMHGEEKRLKVTSSLGYKNVDGRKL